MSKEIYISSTPHETRLAIVEKDELTEIYYERENEYTLAGSIYNGKVTRVLPGMQSSFVDIGLERDAFLYITDFMEEQGENADFESGSAPGEARGGRRERGRPKREGEAAAASPESEADGRVEERPDRAERPERGDRADRPDRNGHRDRRRDAPRAEARDEAEPLAAAFPENTRSTDAAGASEDESASEEVGSGAPGADGSRRWRGRRGRRRGRGPSETNGTGSGSTPAAELEVGGVAETPETFPESFFEADAPETSARTEGRSSQESRERSRERLGERPASGERSDGRELRHDDRRGDRAGRREETGRGRGSRFDQRADDSEGLDLSAAAEPFILPGESLSKYRKGEDGAVQGASQPARTATPAATLKPSTEFELKGSWDGGNTLPGETLSRYRERPAAPQAQAPAPRESRGFTDTEGSAAGRDRRRERDQRRSRPAYPESSPSERPARTAKPSLDPAEAVQPGVSSFHEPEDVNLPLYEDGSARPEATVDDLTVAAFEEAETEASPEAFTSADGTTAAATYEPQTDLAPASTENSQPAVLEAVEEFHETVAEFEPGDDASASYRVDPAGPSEFRQNAPDADVLVEERFEEDVQFDAKNPLAETGLRAEGSGEFTTLQPSGELISEWPLTPDAEDAKQEAAADAAPIAHEKAVQSVSLEEAEAPAAPALGFNPGAGQLEEELLDDEDGDLPQLQASFGDDDMEEETLEGASELNADLGSDLGTMIREMSIDEITSADPADEDEDDFDLAEDELEEDELDAEDEDFSENEGAETPLSEGEPDDDSDSLDEFAEEPAALDAAPSPNGTPAREGERRERRDGRRGGRERDRGRDRRGPGGSRAGGHSNGRMSRHQAQTSDLPAISDLLKPGQELLVQIAKEPMAKKGARITSHIALPGRFLVFMPTVQHVGVSRKIESDTERRRLKEILISERGEASGGFIVRTAASGASEEELRSDLRFLLNLWADIKQRSESSKSPALIYHDLNLVERILRDQVTDNFSAIWVDTEAEYERVLRFLQRFQPSLIRRVKLYTKDTPLFEQFGISEEINKALRSKVWLKSGGSIVINQTEALVAIDINTGKYVGKTARLEDTIVKTNLDAIPEIVRQIRLRDLGGIIVIDFIDMDERKNRTKVLAALEEELKKDRAPSKVLQFNDFGLVAITRKRVKQSLERTLSQTCNTCAGTGMVKSPVTVCNEIFIEFRKMHKHLEKGDVMLRVNPEVVKQLKSNGGKWLQELEEVAGKTILVKSDPSLHPEQFDIQ